MHDGILYPFCAWCHMCMPWTAYYVNQTLPHRILPCRAVRQGNIAAWRKAEGQAIAPGDVLAEVETDKATIEWEAQEEGYLAKILMGDGERA